MMHEQADRTSEVVEAVHGCKEENKGSQLGVASGSLGIGRPTVSMGVCDKYSIYPPQPKFREPLYGGRLEAFANIDDNSAGPRMPA